MGTTFTGTTSLTTISCKCGGVYAIQERYREQKEFDGGAWTCPYCQTGWGYGESEKKRLERQLKEAADRLASERARHDQTRAERDHQIRRVIAQRAQTTKIKNRVRAGLCPFCRRNFVALGEHVRKQHPDKAIETTET
jgi:hypothetical protein